MDHSTILLMANYAIDLARQQHPNASEAELEEVAIDLMPHVKENLFWYMLDTELRFDAAVAASNGVSEAEDEAASSLEP